MRVRGREEGMGEGEEGEALRPITEDGNCQGICLICRR